MQRGTHPTGFEQACAAIVDRLTYDDIIIETRITSYCLTHSRTQVAE